MAASRVMPVGAVPPDESASPRVLFVAGAHRAGSTLLGAMLGQVPGYCSVGELVHVWDVAGSDRHCGCGAPFSRCPFWREVGTVAFGGWEAADLRRFAELQGRVDRIRHLPATLASGILPAHRARVREYAQMLEALYRAVARVAGCRVVVDTSKRSSTALALRRGTALDLRIVHLVRDSRGVAHSLSRPPSATPLPGEAPLPRSHPLRGAVQWVVDNLLAEWLRLAGPPSARVTYEELVADPRGALERLLARVDRLPGPGHLDFIGADGVSMAPTHSADGNPSRFTAGAVSLSRDERWRTDMARHHRLAVTGMTWPLLLRYGYGRATTRR